MENVDLDFIYRVLVRVLVAGWAIYWGFICSCVAERNHRSPGLGLILGIMFGCFAAIGYWAVGKPLNQK
jgi:hypothetical protein